MQALDDIGHYYDIASEKIDVVDHGVLLFPISMVPVVGDLFLQLKEHAIEMRFNKARSNEQRVHWIFEKNRIKRIEVAGNLVQMAAIIALVAFTALSAWSLLLLIPFGLFTLMKVSSIGMNNDQIERASGHSTRLRIY